MVSLNAREIFRYLSEHARPYVMRPDGIRLIYQGDFGTLRRFSPVSEFKGVPRRPLTSLPRIDTIDQRYFVRRTLLEVPSDLRVDTLGILTHDDEIDVFRLLILEWTKMFGIQLDRTEVDIEIQAKPQSQDNRALNQPRLYVRMSYGAQQDSIQIPPLVDQGVANKFFRFEVVFAAVGILDELVFEPLVRRYSLHHLQGFLGYFGTNPVTSYDADVV